MGDLLSILPKQKATLPQTLSLQQLRQYHAIYKSQYQTFQIPLQKFNQIFPTQFLKIYQQQKLESINALEIFSGLTCFTDDVTFKEKLKFLFMMFDFNQIKSISIVDLEYLIVNVVNFCYRLVGRDNSKADIVKIAEWLVGFFNPKDRINITSLYKFCTTSQELTEFFALIQKPIQPDPLILNHLPTNSLKHYQQKYLTKSYKRQLQINDKLHYFTNLSQKLTKNKTNSQRISNIELKWIYGIDIEKIRKPLLCVGDDLEEVMYCVGSYVVVYGVEENLQRVFREHVRDVRCFCWNGKDSVASSQGEGFSKVYIWDYHTMKTSNIITLDHPYELLAMQYNHTSTLLLTAGNRPNTPIYIYQTKNYTLQTCYYLPLTITNLCPFFSSVSPQEIPDKYYNHFIYFGGKKVCLVDDQYQQYFIDFQEEVCCMCVGYLNGQSPFLRVFNVDNLRIVIVTGHTDGSIYASYFSDGIFDQKQQVQKLQHPITNLHLTSTTLHISTSTMLILTPLTLLIPNHSKTQIPQQRQLNLQNYPQLKLLDCQIQYFDVGVDQIYILTKGGDLVVVGDRQIQYEGEEGVQEVESMKVCRRVVRFAGDMGAMCWREDGSRSLYVVSEGNKVVQLDSQTHEVVLINEQQCEQPIVAIDSATTEDNVHYIIYGLKDGTFIVNVSGQLESKSFKCNSELLDLKISKDVTYLLIATTTSLNFFQISLNFSSPRKITFQNQSPNCINFLDNYQFATVSTTAKNIYLIQLPQLKYKNIIKQNQNISVSLLQYTYPVAGDKGVSYSTCFLGGDVCFCLFGLIGGDIMFFQSMEGLASRNYRIMPAHQGEIATIMIDESQQTIYTLGKQDKLLIQWQITTSSPEPPKELFPKGTKVFINTNDMLSYKSINNNLNLSYTYLNEEDQQFQRIKQISKLSKEELLCDKVRHKNVGFYFRGTKNQKLNKSLVEFADGVAEKEMEVLKVKRMCNLVVELEGAYGIQLEKGRQLRYRTNGNFLYSTSRFIIECYPDSTIAHIHQEIQHKVSYFALNYKDELIYTTISKNPTIIHNHTKLQTTHKNTIIHFALHNNFILSYAISNQQEYSINLHNYETGQLLAQKNTNLRIYQFIMINQDLFVSLNQLRLWDQMVPSEPLGRFVNAVLLPNGQDLCLGGQNGALSVMRGKKIYEVVRHAHHNKAIIVMHLRTNHTNNNDFEIITAGFDEKLKIWNSRFEQILSISVPEYTQPSFPVIKQAEGPQTNHILIKPTKYLIKELDTHKNKIILALSFGQIWQLTLSSYQQIKTTQNEDQSKKSIQSNSSQSIIYEQSQHQPQRIKLNTITHKKKLLDLNTFNNHKTQKSLVFDIHQQLNIMAMANNGGRLIFRTVDNDTIVGNYVCSKEEGVWIRAIRFSKGRMLLVGFSNGVVVSFMIQLDEDESGMIGLQYYQTFKPEPFMTSKILSLKYSPEGQFFLVSHLPPADKPEDPQLRQIQSYLKIYRQKPSTSLNENQAFYELHDEIYLKDINKNLNKIVKCIHEVSFIKGDGGLYLVYGEDYEEDGNVVIGKKGKYFVYDVEKKQAVENQYLIDWGRASFCDQLLAKQVNQAQQINEEYKVTAMTHYTSSSNHSYLLCGGMDGTLHLLKPQTLLLTESPKTIKHTNMLLSRSYPTHVSYINSIQTSADKQFIFVSCFGNQSILKYRITQENIDHYCQYQNYPREIEDVHGEVVGRNMFEEIVNSRQPLRQELANILEDVEDNKLPRISLEIVRIYGRRSLDRRYNLCYLSPSTILYTIGPNIILQNLQTKNQQILSSDPSPYSHHPQISTFHYNGNYLILATEQQKCRLLVWDIRSKCCIRDIRVEECSVVMRMVGLGDLVVLVGIGWRYELGVFVVDWRGRGVVAKLEMPFTGIWTIRDLCVYHPSQHLDKFVTCGHKQLTLYTLKGSHLSTRNLNKTQTSYLCLTSQNDTIICGCEQGSLYFYKGQILIQTIQKLHRAAIRCVISDIKNKMVVTGGKDGVICVVDVGGREVLRKVSLMEEETSVKSLDLEEERREKEIESFKVDDQVQALDLNEEQILVGTRSGNIYQISNTSSTNTTTASLFLQSHDNKQISSFTFTPYDESSFYTLTNTGIIQKWSLNTYNKQFQFNIQQKAFKIVSCNNYLVVCCKNDVLAYQINREYNVLMKVQKYCVQVKSDSNDREKQFEIIQFCMASNQRDYALCIKVGLKQPSYLLNIYQFGRKEYIYQLINLKHEIDYLDFSTDHKYLLFKDRYEEIGMINLEKDYKRINTIFVQMNIQWENDGLRISPKGQKIYYSYSCENKITAIQKINNNKIVVGDEMGTIRIFDYPCESDQLGELHLQCYTNHMNYIRNIKVHPNKKYVVSSAAEDRSLILWRVLEEEIFQ